MTTPDLKAEIVDRVGVVSFNQPHRHNAVTDALFNLGNHSVRCVLIRGEDPSFCSGRDKAELGKRTNGKDDFTRLSRSNWRRRQFASMPFIPRTATPPCCRATRCTRYFGPISPIPPPKKPKSVSGPCRPYRLRGSTAAPPYSEASEAGAADLRFSS
jgi:hypothetical protein